MNKKKGEKEMKHQKPEVYDGDVDEEWETYISEPAFEDLEEEILSTNELEDSE